MIEGISLDQVNATGLLIMVFVMRNELKNQALRIGKLEDKVK